MPEPRWLNNEETETWLSLIAVSALVFERLDRNLKDTTDLSLAEYEAMVLLDQGPPEGTGMTALAQAALVSKSLVSYTVSGLERQGLVERVPHPTDGRGRLARLTAKGRRTMKRIAPAHVEQVRSLVFDPLTKKQVRELRDALKVIEARVRD